MNEINFIVSMQRQAQFCGTYEMVFQQKPFPWGWINAGGGD